MAATFRRRNLRRASRGCAPERCSARSDASTDAFVDQYYDQFFDNLPIGASLAEINRNLDVVWQEAYGISPQWAPIRANANDASTPYAAPPRYEMPNRNPPRGAAASNWHDGYYFADSYTTATSANANPEFDPGSSRSSFAGDSRRDQRVGSHDSRPDHRPASPFFLTVDSPIDQVPSVDAVAAARLRGLDVTHINHLMNQDPNRLSDALGLAGVTAATIRRWQSECRLVCHVPQFVGLTLNPRRMRYHRRGPSFIDRPESFA